MFGSFFRKLLLNVFNDFFVMTLDFCYFLVSLLSDDTYVILE